jgi:hypothetical protein
MLVVLLGIVLLVALGGIVNAVIGRGASSAAREGVPLPAIVSPPAIGAIPAEWGWAHLNERGQKSVGYYYRDRAAGPSFHVLFEAAGRKPTTDELRVKGYRGDVTKRLGAHETMQIPDGAEALATMLRGRFESGGASGCIVLRMTSAERRELGLPDQPPWIGPYVA